MSAQSFPQMSVVIVKPDLCPTIRETVEHLRKQTGTDRIELVIVTPSSAELDLSEIEREGFWAVRVVEVGKSFSRGRARVVGVHQAVAPVVAFIEDHAYPAKGWAEALLKAHEQSWAAVGPVIANANPGATMSWANFFILYGPWIEGAEGGISDDIPGENSSYKSHVLRDYGPELDSLMDGAQDSVMHRGLRARGHQLYLEPRAKVYHYNFESLSASVKEHFGCGRSFAAARARPWSALRRVLYAGGAPLIPLVRFRRIWKDIQRSGKSRDLLPGIIPALLLGLITGALGEMAGYAFGPGNEGP
jgi:glycosyltransferase involved in cell wall biosynthesis